MAARSGFTLVEVLLAAVLGAGIMAIATQQLIGYLRLQQVLMTRATLRQDTRTAMAQLGAELRQSSLVLPLSDGYVLLEPKDENHNGVLDAADQLALVRYRLAADPLDPSRQSLWEQTVDSAAFQLPTNGSDLLPLFGEMGRGKRVMSALQQLTITQSGTHAWQVTLNAAQAVSRQAEPVRLSLRETFAARTDSLADPNLPTLQKLLALNGGAP